jgi:hypothetical protein
MHHSIKLSDEAYRAYERRARRVGLTVDEYLDRSAPSDDGFVLTPEMRAGIERGLAQADAGQLIGLGQGLESEASQKRCPWFAD